MTQNHNPDPKPRETAKTQKQEKETKKAPGSVTSTPQRQEDSPTDFAVVAIGASAGGLQAVQRLFRDIPENPGMAFVIVVHLSPEYDSAFAELLQPYSKLPVNQVTESVRIEENHVYVIPPDANLNSVDTHLRLSELEERRSERALIDHFFRTVADTHDGHSIGIILTGTGHDGALGIEEIRSKGGVTIVQDPADAEFDGMPSSAIATGRPDMILSLDRMAAALMKLGRTRPRIPIFESKSSEEKNDDLIHEAVALVRGRTGKDFSRYKRNTIRRRIERRMQLCFLEEPEEYLRLLRRKPEEIHVLAEDLLITVTHFFRDRESFEELQKKVLPKIFDDRNAEDEVRIWSVGCATGEEAYSIAIIAMEAALAANYPPPTVRIYASDPHEPSLKKAREGFYPGDISQHISPERLKRWFKTEKGGYRVNRTLREMVVFSSHNLLVDPPFSRLDLVSCRNLLIYLQRETQKNVIELFHYSLKRDGFLFLGSSESISDKALFADFAKKHALFQKKNIPTPSPSLSPFTARGRSSLVGVSASIVPSGGYDDLHARTLERLSPPSILISEDDKIVHLSEHAGRYLLHPGGAATNSVFKLVRKELRIEIQALVQSARETDAVVRSRPVMVRFEGAPNTSVILRARCPQEAGMKSCVLIIFDEVGMDSEETKEGKEKPKRENKTNEVEELEAELELTRRRLKKAIDEHETYKEEVRASGEEMQSTNEELRSTMEELETSKEELQSVNEELQTVNQENRHKVEELGQLTADLNNLLKATDIATIFLDRSLNIQRLTPKAESLFRAQQTDRGRPIADLRNRLGYDELEKDADQVLSSLIPVEKEFADDSGNYFLARILPYRGGDDRIEGVVVTFIDITERHQVEQQLRESEERLRKMLDISGIGILTFDKKGRVRTSNEAFLEMTGYSEKAEVEDLSWRDLTPVEYLEENEKRRRALDEVGNIGPYESQYTRTDGSRAWYLGVARKLDENTTVEFCVDIAEQKRTQVALKESQRELSAELAAMTRLQELISRLLLAPGLDSALDEVLSAAIGLSDGAWGIVHLYDSESGLLSLAAERGLDEDLIETVKRIGKEIQLPFERAARDLRREVVEDMSKDEGTKPIIDAMDVTGNWFLQSSPLLSRGGELMGTLTTATRGHFRQGSRESRYLDLYARQAADFLDHMRRSEREKEDGRRKDEFIATLAHELRNPLVPIVTGIDLLRSATEEEARNETISLMQEQTVHMLRLVDDLTEMSRITRGTLQLKPEDGDLRDIVNAAVEYVKHAFEEKDQSLEIDMPTENIAVYADKQRISQVVANLLNNASKYTPTKGKVKLTVTIYDSQMIIITVEDNGIGIAKEETSRIFDVFSQVERGSGLGIGLNLVQNLVALHSGTVEVQSEGKSRGSAFTVRLPIRKKTDDGIDVGSPVKCDMAELPISIRKVLVVEDQKEVRRAIELLVCSLGPEVILAENGKEALAAFRASQPDIIFMDLGMPVMNGYETAQEIRKDPEGKKVPIIALSGWGQETDKKRSSEAGFTEHLLKPPTKATLRDVLVRYSS